MPNSPFFQKTTDVLPSLKPYYQWEGFHGQEFVSSTNNIFADLNRDNLPDLVFHFWSGQNSENAGTVVSGGSPNRLVVLLSNGDGTYSDGTFTLTQSDNPIQLDGVSRKSLDHDFNADGYQDIFFAINREDGRSGQPPETNSAFSAAILSAGNGQYEIKNLGIENWYHSIGIIPTDTGVEVWLGGYSQSSGQNFRDATVQLASGFGYKLGDTQTSFSPVIQVPGHANTFTAIPNLLDLENAKQVVSVVDIFSGGAGLGLFVKDSDNNWILSSTNFPHSSQTTVNFVSHSGNLGQTPVTELDGKVVLAIGHSASGVLQLFPDSPFIAGFKASGAVVANPRSDGAFYEQDAQPFSTIQFYSTENDTLTRLPITIVGEDQSQNGNFIEFMDLTNDDLTDIVVYPYSNTGSPTVYANTGAGVFIKVPDNKFPQEATNWGTAASSAFFDYNKDGVQDLIIGPMNGIQRDHPQQDWVLFRGTDYLNIDDITDPITITNRFESTVIKTWSGNDIIFDTNSNGNSTDINAGNGIDTIVYSLSVDNYTASEINKSIIVTPIDPSIGGADTLTSIEVLQFSDGVAQLTDLIRPEDIDRGIYRFFNVDTGTHFLSGSTVERDSVINNLDAFNFEGPTFRAADPTNAAADTVFRFFNTQTGTHFFTQSTLERDNILDTLPQFSFEGEAYKGYTEQVDGSIPLYRFFNTQTGTHFYTAAEAEKDSIIENLPTFNFEGTAYWVDPVMG